VRKPRTSHVLRGVAAAGLVLGGSAAAFHQPARAAGPVNIIFWAGPDTTNPNYTQLLIDNFNKTESGKIHVTWQVQAADTGQYFNTVSHALQAKSAVPDVIMGDVIWPAQLASRGYLLPVDKYFPAADQKNYLGGPIADLQYKGHIYGAPFFTDYGLIYYRKDLLSKYNMAVPTTWEQMQQEAVTLVKKGAVKEGFVFQGNQYEGLVCDALEYIWGAGGQIYGPDATKTTAQAAKGLTTMASMISSGASPKAVATYQESQSETDWLGGLAAFMRNWPYAWGQSQLKSSGSKVIGKVGVLPLLHEAGQKGYSTLGGWNLSINANSKHAAEAWAFIKYMSGPYAQKYLAINEGHTMALKSTYNDPQVVKANPWFKTVIPQLNIRPRPTSPVYNDISLKMQQDFHNVLTGSAQASTAVSDVESFITAAEARFH
jgi:trehalose/maltose transport system substrate-binding protein